MKFFARLKTKSNGAAAGCWDRRQNAAGALWKNPCCRLSPACRQTCHRRRGASFSTP
ncbi:hypothetical protein BOSE21B_100119 [Bosea sp. 21B]|nr:hypothetical protein BOSE21B_100119 [Bosea sp. 21B]CAD5286202.1 hypothetical protein BOSE7B_41410 [Bosea sp. 7B]